MGTDDWYVNKDIGSSRSAVDIYTLINESDSSVVESPTHNPWIGGSNPGAGEYFHFINPFLCGQQNVSTTDLYTWIAGSHVNA